MGGAMSFHVASGGQMMPPKRLAPAASAVNVQRVRVLGGVGHVVGHLLADGKAVPLRNRLCPDEGAHLVSNQAVGQSCPSAVAIAEYAGSLPHRRSGAKGPGELFRCILHSARDLWLLLDGNISLVTGRHRRTLERIFTRPTPASIRWAEVEALMSGRGGRNCAEGRITGSFQKGRRKRGCVSSSSGV